MKKHSVVKYLILTLLIAVTVVLMLTACGGGDKGIVEKGTCGEKVNWKLTEDGVLTISGTGAMKVSSDTWSLSLASTVTSVVVKDGVTEVTGIGNSFTTLKTITLADSVTKLSLGSLPALESISFGSGITQVAADFSESYSLSKVVIKDLAKWCGVTIDTNSGSLGSPFYNGAKLYVGDTAVTDLVIPDGVTAVKPYVFTGLGGVKSITVPASVTEIGSLAFKACSDVETVTVSAQTIGNSAFSECTKLFTLNLGAGVKTIDAYAFSSCAKVRTLNVPNSVTTIGTGAFSACRNLVSVTLGTGVTSISTRGSFGGTDAFSGCPIREVINNSSLSIKKGESKYGGIASGAVEVHKGATKIVEKDGFLLWNETVSGNNYVLAYVGDNSVVTVPSTVDGKTYNAIYTAAFYKNSELVSITIPESITLIGENAFKDCDRLYEIVNNSSFELSDSATYYEGVTTVHSGTSVIVNKDGWLFVDKDDSITTTNVLVGKLGSKNETSLTLPADFEGEGYDIADNAFKAHTDLKSVVIPGNVSNIGSDAFYGCSHLTSVTLNSGLRIIGIRAFASCAIAEITFPNTLEEIYESAFATNRLVNVVIPDSVKWIGKWAFAFYNPLSSVTITSTGWNKCGETFTGDPVDLSNPRTNASLFADMSGNGYYFRRTIG